MPGMETPFSTSLSHTSGKNATKIRRGKRYINLNPAPLPSPTREAGCEETLGHRTRFLSLVTGREPCLLSDSSPSPLLRSARVVGVNMQLSAMLFYKLEDLRLVPWFDNGGITKWAGGEEEQRLSVSSILSFSGDISPTRQKLQHSALRA